MEHEETMGRNRRGGVYFVVGIRWNWCGDGCRDYLLGRMHDSVLGSRGKAREERMSSVQEIPYRRSPLRLSGLHRDLSSPPPPSPWTICMAEESRHWIYRTTV